MTDELSLSEDAFVFGDGVIEKKKTVTLERNVYDALRKRKADLMDENTNLRAALEVILDATQKDNVCIPALRLVAYTALKGE